jgi:hypothetical protein
MAMAMALRLRSVLPVVSSRVKSTAAAAATSAAAATAATAAAATAAAAAGRQFSSSSGSSSGSSSSGSSSGGGASTTYYDSQSGMHVPVNNENEISLFFHAQDETGSPVPLQEIQKAGYEGVLLPLDYDYDKKDSIILFLDARRMNKQKMPYPDHVNILFEYHDSHDGIIDAESDMISALADLVSNDGTIRTSVGLFDSCYFRQDPVMVASGVASLIDKTGTGGIDFIWVQSDKQEEDDSIVELCQQLAYLDVAGPTIKSRLIVQAQTADQVEECLDIGVNKFVNCTPEWIHPIVKDQGKVLKRAVK